MVKFRGIDISIITQFDILKLPEYRYQPIPSSPDIFRERSTVPTSKSPTASCYVSIYPGSQIWFEYSIDGPHPPKAAYFFKLLLNGNVLTSWDCTAKSGYHGKAMYILTYDGRECFSGTNLIRRHILCFDNSGNSVGNDQQDDIIEVRIHRIEHRKRLVFPDVQLSEAAVRDKMTQGLKIINAGLVEPGLPKRRYKYQLLDPLDEPYAIFRFYYRSYDFLVEYGIIPMTVDLSSSSENSPISPHVNTTTPLGDGNAFDESCLTSNQRSTCTTETLPAYETPTRKGNSHGKAAKEYLQPNNSNDSLSIITKDSIEELPSLVPRSPNSRSSSSRSIREQRADIPPSPSVKQSPRRRLRKRSSLSPLRKHGRRQRNSTLLSPFASDGTLRELRPHHISTRYLNGVLVDNGKDETGKLRGNDRQSSLIRDDKIPTKEHEKKSFKGFLGLRKHNE